MRFVPLPPLDYSRDRTVMPPTALLGGHPISGELGRDRAVALTLSPRLEDSVHDRQLVGNRDHATAVAVHPETQRRV